MDGEFRKENRRLIEGDLIEEFAQMAPPLQFFARVGVVRVTEVRYEANQFVLQYQAEPDHIAIGLWRAEVTRCDGRLKIRIRFQAGPRHWLFWVGFPYAWLMLRRAANRGIEHSRRIEG